jgi:hypothetical protein
MAFIAPVPYGRPTPPPPDASMVSRLLRFFGAPGTEALPIAGGPLGFIPKNPAQGYAHMHQVLRPGWDANAVSRSFAAAPTIQDTGALPFGLLLPRSVQPMEGYSILNALDELRQSMGWDRMQMAAFLKKIGRY